jgi:EAL domain-containing protein (putative c-di-GMP-specific phosphodiesterase class I)
MLDNPYDASAAQAQTRTGFGRMLRKVARILPGRRDEDDPAQHLHARAASHTAAGDEPLSGPFSAGGPFGIDPSRPHSGGVVPLDQRAVERLMMVIRKSGVHATAGKIQLVHLDELRRRVGPQWPELADTAMQIAEFVLRVRLEPSDIFTRYDNYAFIVVFSMIDQTVAERKAEAMRKEILDILMADPRFAQVLDVLSVTAPLLDFVDEDEPLTLKAIDDGLSGDVRPEAETARPDNLPDWLDTYQTIYRPIISADSMTVSCHMALPKGTLLDGTEVQGARVYPAQTASGVALPLDTLLIGDALDALERAIAEGRDGMVASLVSLPSLLHPKRELIGRLAATSDEQRARFALEIIGLPPSVPASHVVNVLGELRRYTAMVILRVGLAEGDFAQLRNLGLQGVVCDLGSREAAKLSVGEQHAAILDVVSRAKAADLKTLCFGLATDSLVKTAKNAGADYLAGDAVGDFVAEP